MDYYKLRSRVHQETKTFLSKREELIEQNLKPPPLSSFMLRMVGEYGVTNKMIKTMIEDLVPGATVEGGEIVIKNE